MLEKTYKILTYTVRDCPRHISPGLFIDQTRIFIYVGQSHDVLQEVFSEDNKRFREHPKVAAVKLVSLDSNAR
jgi:hypothetical protein